MRVVFQRHHRLVVIILLGMLVVGGVVLVIRSVLWHPAAVQAETPTVVSETYHLVDGWNLIAFPFKPTTITTAGELVASAAYSGGEVSMVSRWDGDRWQEFVRRGDQVFGMDFPLIQGEAYFVLNHADVVSWVVSGLKTKSQSSTLALKKGWNAVGLGTTTLADAGVFLQTANDPKTDTVSQIDRWLSGNWDVFVRRVYDETNQQEYGNNFSFQSTQGYMVQSSKDVTVEVGK